MPQHALRPPHLTRRQFHTGAMAAAGLLASGGRVAAQQPLPILRIIQSGHSLTDSIIPPLHDMINAAGGRGTNLIKTTVPGAPMQIRWEDHIRPAHTPDVRDPAVMAECDIMVNTERVALSNTMPYHDTLRYALLYFENAWKYGRDGKGAPSLLYSTWVNIDSGPDFANPENEPDGLVPFRQRLDSEAVLWEQILDHVNQNRPEGSPAMKMIPGTLVMAEAYDQIAAGKAPGISDYRALFRDDIHNSVLGGYLIALAHFAVIYNRDPHGLPGGVPSKGGASPEQAAWMQDLVWQVVTAYAKAGTDGSGKLPF